LESKPQFEVKIQLEEDEKEKRSMKGKDFVFYSLISEEI